MGIVVRTDSGVYDLDGVLDPDLIRFVDLNVRSLLTWDILVFFQRNPDAVIDVIGLAGRLGRHVGDIEPEIAPLCESSVLDCAGGLIRYRPAPHVDKSVNGFVDACQDKALRLALIARVLNNIGQRATGGN